MKLLKGKWYHYFYGVDRFWEDEVIIYDNGSCEYIYNGEVREIGKVINQAYQSTILFEDIKSKKLFSMIFDNQSYKLENACFTRNIDKQYEKELYLYSIGILSRKPIELEVAKNILGDMNKVRMLEENEMVDRLSIYLRDVYLL